MKVIEAHSGLLTNFEVLDFLRGRGAGQGFVGAVNSVTQPELKVYEYLVKTPAATQSHESLKKFSEEPLTARLMKPERLQVANLRPVSPVEIHLLVEDIQRRFSDEEVEEFLARVSQALPEPPERPEAESAVEQGATEDAEAMEE